jgi:DNA-binding XRE family transcriptional regulator
MHIADGAPNREGMPDRPPAFHELLVSYRVQANVSRQDLAEALGVGVQAVETYECPPGRSSARTPPLDLAPPVQLLP